MNSQKSFIKTLFICGLSLLFLWSTSCVSTRVEASPYEDAVVNLECQKISSWSYFWGLKQKRVDTNPEVLGSECPCSEQAMSWVETKSSLGDFVLSLVTLGAVNHRTVTYGCARPRDGEGGLDD